MLVREDDRFRAIDFECRPALPPLSFWNSDTFWEGETSMWTDEESSEDDSELCSLSGDAPCAWKRYKEMTLYEGEKLRKVGRSHSTMRWKMDRISTHQKYRHLGKGVGKFTLWDVFELPATFLPLDIFICNFKALWPFTISTGTCHIRTYIRQKGMNQHQNWWKHPYPYPRPQWLAQGPWDQEAELFNKSCLSSRPLGSRDETAR